MGIDWTNRMGSMCTAPLFLTSSRRSIRDYDQKRLHLEGEAVLSIASWLLMSSSCVSCSSCTFQVVSGDSSRVPMLFEAIPPPARVVDLLGVMSVGVGRYALFSFLNQQCADFCVG